MVGLIAWNQQRHQKKICFALAHRIRCALPLASLQSAVCELRKTESLAIKIDRPAGIAHPELDVVNAPQLDGVLHYHLGLTSQTHETFSLNL